MTIHKVNTPAARFKRAAWMTALLVGAVVVGPQALANGDDEPAPTNTYTVMPGETLWAIASTVGGPGDDVRDVIAEIQDLNEMSTSQLQAGEQILVPVRDH